VWSELILGGSGAGVFAELEGICLPTRNAVRWRWIFDTPRFVDVPKLKDGSNGFAGWRQ